MLVNIQPNVLQLETYVSQWEYGKNGGALATSEVQIPINGRSDEYSNA